MKRILIIDCDSVSFRAAAASEKRTVICQHLPSGRQKEFPTRTALKKSLEEKSFKFDPIDWTFTDLQHPEPESHTNALVKSQIESMIREIEPDEVEVYLGSGLNFRNQLALPRPYKGSRGDAVRPVNLLKAREYAKKKYKAVDISYTNCETDDVVVIRAYEELNKGNLPFIGTVDKDSNQANGITLVNWTKNPMEIKTIPLIGELWKDKNNAIKGTGIKFLCLQWLMGDETDSYCPYDLSSIKYGPTKAMNALKDCDNLQDMYDTVLREYDKMYPNEFEYVTWNANVTKGNAQSMLDMYFKCAYMKRSWDDQSDYKAFFSSLGVKV